MQHMGVVEERAGGRVDGAIMLRLLRLVIVLSCCSRHLPRLLPPLLLLLQALAADIRLSCELWRDAFNGFDMSHDDAFKGGDARLADAVEERLQVCQSRLFVCLWQGGVSARTSVHGKCLLTHQLLQCSLAVAQCMLHHAGETAGQRVWARSGCRCAR